MSGRDLSAFIGHVVMAMRFVVLLQETKKTWIESDSTMTTLDLISRHSMLGYYYH